MTVFEKINNGASCEDLTLEELKELEHALTVIGVKDRDTTMQVVRYSIQKKESEE